MPGTEPILRVEHLVKHYPIASGGGLGRRTATVKAAPNAASFGFVQGANWQTACPAQSNPPPSANSKNICRRFSRRYVRELPADPRIVLRFRQRCWMKFQPR